MQTFYSNYLVIFFTEIAHKIPIPKQTDPNPKLYSIFREMNSILLNVVNKKHQMSYCCFHIVFRNCLKTKPESDIKGLVFKLFS